MATQKAISTISYNSEAFLKEKLDRWIKAHIIQAYQYICHKGEDGDKDHIHLRVEPNKKLDQMDLTESLREYVQGSDKPLGVRPWRPSSEEDWFLYVVHDPDYLRLKYGGGEKGEKLPYNWEQIQVSESYDLEIAFIRAKAKLEHTAPNLVKKIKKGVKPDDLILQGESVFTINAVMTALGKTNYAKLRDAYGDLYSNLMKVYSAIGQYGLYIYEDQDGEFFLSPTQLEGQEPMGISMEDEWMSIPEDDNPFMPI